MAIIIDNQYFDVHIIDLERSADFVDKYAERAKNNAELKRELIGVFFNYNLKIGVVKDMDTYNKLYNLLSKPIEFHTVTLPGSNGDYTFKAYVSGLKDKCMLARDGNNVFYELTVRFIAKSPARIKGG